MKKTIFLFSLVCFGLASCGDTASENKTETTATDTTVAATPPVETTAPPMDSAAQAKAWEESMTPGEMHKMMESWNGKWKAEMTMWMDPSAPPTTSTMETDNKMLYGRYQQSTSKGEFMGMPFEGVSTMGFNNTTQKFESSWIDNMGTGVMRMEGTWDAGSKTINLTGECMDPMTKQSMKMRETYAIVDDKTQVMTSYQTKAGGQEFKAMEIKFTRK